MKGYKNLFIDAIKRTAIHKLELDTPLIDTLEQYIQVGVYEDITLLLNSEYPEFEKGILAFNCHKVSYSMKPILEKYFETELYLTIGYVSAGETTFFEVNESQITNLLIQKPKEVQETIPFHVWLTLPSMEIIDLTFGQSFAKKSTEDIPMNQFLLRHPDQLSGSMQYHPMIIGEDFLKSVGVLKEEFI